MIQLLLSHSFLKHPNTNLGSCMKKILGFYLNTGSQRIVKVNRVPFITLNLNLKNYPLSYRGFGNPEEDILHKIIKVANKKSVPLPTRYISLYSKTLLRVYLGRFLGSKYLLKRYLEH